MNDTGVTPERRNPSENGHSWSLSCNVAFDEILELRKNPVDGVTGTRPSGYSHTSVPTLVDELHRCSLLGDELLGSFLQAPLLYDRVVPAGSTPMRPGRSCRLHSCVTFVSLLWVRGWTV